MQISFLSIGLMGAPMVRRLLAAGHTVTVWNRSHLKAEALGAAVQSADCRCDDQYCRGTQLKDQRNILAAAEAAGIVLPLIGLEQLNPGQRVGDGPDQLG